MTNKFRAGSPAGYLEPDTRKIREKYYCQDCNQIFMENGAVCPSCGKEKCITHEAWLIHTQLLNSPKAMKSSGKVQPERKPIKIEVDFENERRLKNERKQKIKQS